MVYAAWKDRCFLYPPVNQIHEGANETRIHPTVSSLNLNRPFLFYYPVGLRVRSLKWLGFKRMGLTMKAFMYVLYKTAALYRPHHKDIQLILHSQHSSGTCSCATGLAAPLSVHWSFVWYRTETMGWFLFHKSRRNNNQCVTGLTLFPFVGLERHEKKPTLMTKIKFAVNPR